VTSSAVPIAFPGSDLGAAAFDDDQPREFVRSLDRGLAVLRAFGTADPTPSLSDIARAVGLAPATARRLLHTLETLGYVETNGRTWMLRPRVLELGNAYLATTGVWDVVRRRLEELAADVELATSAGVLDGEDVVYTTRVPVRRIMSMAIEVGTRIPAYASSMGRVLLAQLTEPELDRYLSTVVPEAITPRTVSDTASLRAIIDRVREDGYCLMEEELELGVQCVAAPIRELDGRVFAAVTVSSHTTVLTLEQVRTGLLPRVLEAARAIDDDLRLRPSPHV
jgi:IclR family pca regulon transcriptional regulator